MCRRDGVRFIGDITHPSQGGAPGNGTPSHERSYAGEQVKVQLSVGDAGADGAGEGLGVHQRDSGRSGHRVPRRPGGVAVQGTFKGGPKGYRNSRYGRPRNLTLISGTVEVWKRRVRAPTQSIGSRAGCCRCSRVGRRIGRTGGATVPARPGRGGLRSGVARSAGRRGAPIEVPPCAVCERSGSRHVGWDRRSLSGRELL